jgi:hypothetical protein
VERVYPKLNWDLIVQEVWEEHERTAEQGPGDGVHLVRFVLRGPVRDSLDLTCWWRIRKRLEFWAAADLDRTFLGSVNS